ncbi:MAG: hypothetical protein ACREVK_14050 [Gammaproteobacteria bacterium]
MDFWGDLNEAKLSVLQGELKKAVAEKSKRGQDSILEEIRSAKDNKAQPVERRYVVNDPPVEKLANCFNQNPNGLLRVPSFKNPIVCLRLSVSSH